MDFMAATSCRNIVYQRQEAVNESGSGRTPLTSLEGEHGPFKKIFQRNPLTVEIKVEIKHGGATFGALEGIISETEEDGIAPLVEGKEETVLLS